MTFTDILAAFRVLWSSPLPWYSLFLFFVAGFLCGCSFRFGIEYLRFRSEQREKKYQREKEKQLASEEKARKNAILEKFEMCSGGDIMTAKGQPDGQKYCAACAFREGIVCALKQDEAGWLYCPYCGERKSSPPVIRPRGSV